MKDLKKISASSIRRTLQAEHEPEPLDPWFAIRVKTRHEKSVSAALKTKGYEVFLPLYTAGRVWAGRPAMVDLPLFENYVFCRFDFARRLPILSTPGVSIIVSNGSTPTPVDPREIEHLRKVVSSNLHAELCSRFEVGQKVTIIFGPLKDVEGIVLESNNRHRLIVSISLLLRSVAVEIDPLWVQNPGTKRLAMEIAQRGV